MNRWFYLLQSFQTVVIAHFTLLSKFVCAPLTISYHRIMFLIWWMIMNDCPQRWVSFINDLSFLNLGEKTLFMSAKYKWKNRVSLHSQNEKLHLHHGQIVSQPCVIVSLSLRLIVDCADPGLESNNRTRSWKATFTPSVKKILFLP